MQARDRAALRGTAHLLAEGVKGAAEVVEEMHARISPLGGRQQPDGRWRARGISGAVYAAVRACATLAARGARGGGFASPAQNPQPPRARLQALQSALNGVAGHHLDAAANPLAIRMALCSGGRALDLERSALRRTFPAAGPRLLVLVHGLCMNDRQWLRRGHDHGAALAAELGYTPLYLRYNTGLHVSQNGRALAHLLERLLAQWPVPAAELTLLGHSMGGLVARSALRSAGRAGLRWPAALRGLVFLGTPHAGSPLERAGNRLQRALAATRYTAPLARVGGLRSAGITDLRFGSVADTDWRGADRFAAGHAPAPRADDLVAGRDCYTVAASLGRAPRDLRDRVLGDGLVPVRSALGRSAGEGLEVDPAREWVAYGRGHLDLLNDPEVYRRIRGWLAERASAGP
jgi:hypothetical protein